MSTFEAQLDAAGFGRVKVDGQDIDVRSFCLTATAGEVPEVVIVREAFTTDVTLEAEITMLDPVTILAEVWEFYRAWGETEDADPLALWEDLGRILRGGGE